MGLNISEIIPKKELNFPELKGKVIAVDAPNVIYQFLSIIRQRDGTPLMDSKGNVTSHLSGLFYRNINLMNEGLKLVYVFDGESPKLKSATHSKRRETKKKAQEKYDNAEKEGREEEMLKYAKQITKITPRIIQESKDLLRAMGIPVVQAPGEGEAQAAYMCKIGKAYAVGSQDYDALLFQAPRLLQNMTMSKKRKTVSSEKDISPQMISLEKVLNSLQVNEDQLICLGILIGTDYNPKGVPGIGQKTALKIVREKKYPIEIFKSVDKKILKLDEKDKFDWKEVFEIFHKPNIKDVDFTFGKPDNEKIREILKSKDFSDKRIESGLEKLRKAKEEQQQKTLF